VIQHDLIPELRNDVGPLTPKLEKLIHILEWVRNVSTCFGQLVQR
jgi:hypothetical protein